MQNTAFGQLHFIEEKKKEQPCLHITRCKVNTQRDLRKVEKFYPLSTNTCTNIQILHPGLQIFLTVPVGRICKHQDIIFMFTGYSFILTTFDQAVIL